jgi:hypothetical protein
MIGFAMFSASSPFANITTPASCWVGHHKGFEDAVIAPVPENEILSGKIKFPLDLMIIMDRPQYHEEGIIFITHH